MCRNKIKLNLIHRISMGWLCCVSSLAYGQINSLTDVFDKLIRSEATQTTDGPKVKTQFDFSAENTFITQGVMKIANNGHENHFAVGIAQDFGFAKSRVTYNTYSFNYHDAEKQLGDITYDLNYQSLRVQHRVGETLHESVFGMPLNYQALHLNLSLNRTFDVATESYTEVLKVESQLKRLKFTTTMTDNGHNTSSGFNAQYRLSHQWLTKWDYSGSSEKSQRQIRSEYSRYGYVFAGEYLSKTDSNNVSTGTGALDIEKTSRHAAYKFRVEYQEAARFPSMFFKIRSDISM